MKEIRNLIKELQEKPEYKDFPDEVHEALNTIYEDEVYSTDSDSLTILGNFETENGEVNRILEELYDQAYHRAETFYTTVIKETLRGADDE